MDEGNEIERGSIVVELSGFHVFWLLAVVVRPDNVARSWRM
jgi:hypothetical protein